MATSSNQRHKAAVSKARHNHSQPCSTTDAPFVLAVLRHFCDLNLTRTPSLGSKQESHGSIYAFAGRAMPCLILERSTANPISDFPPKAAPDAAISNGRNGISILYLGQL